MTRNSDISDPLEQLLGAARDNAPNPSDALLARILDDGLAHMPQVEIPAPLPAAPARPRWASFWALIGGWPSAGALAACSAVGLWLGAVPPEALLGWIDMASGADAALWLDTLDSPALFDEVSG